MLMAAQSGCPKPEPQSSGKAKVHITKRDTKTPTRFYTVRYKKILQKRDRRRYVDLETALIPLMSVLSRFICSKMSSASITMEASAAGSCCTAAW
jgi:hypothetical protein